ncbi:CFI-box-CTERM domain-containing protein [uncultured Selenomonas sp.]|uniref:CFI-box-CTERM domain-containing protein n=1 Tax=uncultured Selenomonas sp. TaxID=159275 RepID=UPI0028E4A944|nr:CFI-box-CTERM domain-containing protein [uncultured Selenomonas sp.]
MENHEAAKTIALLTKLLNADLSGKSTAFVTERNAFYLAIEKDLQDFLSKCAMPAQEEIYRRILEIADGMELFSRFPALLGKTLIAAVPLDDAICRRGLVDVIGAEAAALASRDSNIPCVFLPQDDAIRAWNDMGNPLCLSSAEYHQTNSGLWRDGIDIRHFLQSFSLNCTPRFPHIALVYFPLHCFTNALFAKTLMRKLDAVILYASEHTNGSKQEWLLSTFQKLCTTRQIPLYIVAEDTQLDRLAHIAPAAGGELLPEHEIFPVFAEMNRPRHNGLFVDALEHCLQDMENFYQKKLEALRADQQQMSSDLTYITLEKTKEAVRNLAAETRQELHDTEEEHAAMQQMAAVLFRAAESYEAALERGIAASIDQPPAHCRATLILWSRLFLQALSMGVRPRAERCLRKLKQAGDPLSYIYEILLQDANGERIPEHLLRRLRDEHDTEFVRAAKIRLRRHAGFSERDCMQLARDMQQLTTADEFYFRALWVEQNDVGAAIDFYKRALYLGSEAAATRLMELTKTSADITLQELAELMVPEANYALGQELRSKQKFAASSCHFKLAAAKGHIPSIKILTDDLYNSLPHRRSEELSEADRAQCNMAIRLYQYVLQQSPGQEDIKERIGHLYHSLGDERRALDAWRQCETAGAYYARGRLFQYPSGALPQDLDEAAACFKMASALGHAKAADEYNKVKRWKQNDALRVERAEEATRSYAPRVEESPRVTVKSSGCFITSAACAALHKPDNCAELTALRAYRDAVREEDPVVATLITEYYRVAPLIVAAMDAEPDAAAHYRRLWDERIAATYRLIQEARYKEATLCYIRMTEELCERYHITFSDGIFAKIKSLRSSNDHLSR